MVMQESNKKKEEKKVQRPECVSIERLKFSFNDLKERKIKKMSWQSECIAQFLSSRITPLESGLKFQYSVSIEHRLNV